MINFSNTAFETIFDANVFASEWRTAGCRVEIENRYGEMAIERSEDGTFDLRPSAPYFLVLFDEDGAPMGRL